MPDESTEVNLREEVEGLLDCLTRGDTYASVHLARIIGADTKGALIPFAEALSARLSDHLNRYAELGVTDPAAAVDWNGQPKTGRPGEEA